MSPDAEDFETARLRAEEHVPVHVGWRVLPETAPEAPALAWTETERPGEASNSPGENRRLLPSDSIPNSIQSGVTLNVWKASKKYDKYPHMSKSMKTKQKSKTQKRREKIIALLTPPYFIVSMIIVIVFIHLGSSKDFRAKLEWLPGPWWQEPWRLLTYGCVHASTAHLALNALVALAVGWRLEHEQGWWRMVLVWCGGVAAGALGAGALQPHVRVVGASAAVYALLTAHLPNVCIRFGHIPLWWFRPLSVLVLGASEGCWALMRTAPAAGGAAVAAHADSSHENVAWSAHMLGAAVGVPLGFVVFSGENNSKRCILVCRAISGALLVAGVVTAAVYYSLWYEVDET